MLKTGYMFVTPQATGTPIFGPSVDPLAVDSIEVVDIEHKVSHEYDANHGTPHRIYDLQSG